VDQAGTKNEQISPPVPEPPSTDVIKINDEIKPVKSPKGGKAVAKHPQLPTCLPIAMSDD